MRQGMRTLAVLAVLGCLPDLARAQTQRSRVEVHDARGGRVPFALVTLGTAAGVVADDSGRALVTARGDSIRLLVRRIGYKEHFGWVPRGEDGAYAVTLTPLVMTLDTVAIREMADTPLSRSGFYDRMQRVQRGAIVGEFVTPEQLEERSSSQTSNLFVGRRYARVIRQGSRGLPIIVGRASCAVTVLVDGHRVFNLVGEGLAGDAPQSINGAGTQKGSAGNLLTIDQVVDGNDVAAIEIYPSTANAPVEMQTLGGRGSCGVVAIWTGARR